MATLQKRISADGSVKWRVQVRLRGRPTESATFERKTDARLWAQATEAAIREGRYFRTHEARRHTVADLIDRYTETVLPGRIKDEKRRASQLQWWRTQLGRYFLSDLTSALIAEHRDRLAQRRKRNGDRISSSTVTRYLAALSHALSVATKEWGWLQHNPMTGVSRPREPRGRVRYLQPAELERLLSACRESTDPNLYALVELALSTGVRRGELMGLEWDAVDLDRRHLILHDTKNNERRGVPLSNRAVEVLLAHRSAPDLRTGLVFPSPRTGTINFPYKAWHRALAAARVDDFRFHDLRHTTASYLAMNGATTLQIAEVLGHKTLQMVKRYAHLTDGHSRALVESLELSMFGGQETR